MSRKFLMLFVVVAVCATVVMSNPPPKKPIKCDKNEIWNKCASPCEPSCKNPKPNRCKPICIAKCECKKGLLRNNKGKCVEPCDC